MWDHEVIRTHANMSSCVGVGQTLTVANAGGLKYAQACQFCQYQIHVRNVYFERENGQNGDRCICMCKSKDYKLHICRDLVQIQSRHSF